jgi:hypothetical protein
MDAKGTSERSTEKVSVSETKTQAEVRNKQPLVFRCNNNPLFHFRGRGWLDRPIDDKTFKVQHYGCPVLRPEEDRL